jgi:taurine transport system substrate-binding protein
MNAMWLTNSAEMLPVIAKDAGMARGDDAETRSTFQFPTVELSSRQVARQGNARVPQGRGDVFGAGQHPAALDTYDGAVNTGPLAAAAKM